MDQTTGFLCALLLAAAFLYSSVGHAGASGYLAAMALVGIAPETMKPTALVLNVLVASLTAFRFVRADLFSWRGLWPFLLGSIPFSFLGGSLALPGRFYRPAVGVVLLFAGYVLVRRRRHEDGDAQVHEPPAIPAIACGSGIGLLSGLTGTGGGVFLSPLLLLKGWAETRSTAGISATFILANSLAGLAGDLASTRALPSEMPFFVIAAGTGGLIGSHLGSRYFSPGALRHLLALVLVIAALKLVLT